MRRMRRRRLRLRLRRYGLLWWHPSRACCSLRDSARASENLPLATESSELSEARPDSRESSVSLMPASRDCGEGLDSYLVRKLGG